MTVVTVHVDDVNDNSPIFVVPSSVNNTVYMTTAALSRDAQVLLVAVCQATDADDGANARFTYDIGNVSSDSEPTLYDRFRIGRTSGRLTMRVGRAETVSGSENMTFAIVVQASDDGWPSLSTTATLYVVVSHTATFYDDTDDEEDGYWNVWTDSEAGAASTHHNYRSVVSYYALH